MQLQILQAHVFSYFRMLTDILWPLLQRFHIFHFEVAFLDASLIAGSCMFPDHSPVLQPWYLPGSKTSAHFPADVYQVCSLYQSTGCSGLAFDIIIIIIFHSKLDSQLMRRLLCSSIDWDFTVYHEGVIHFLQCIFELIKLQGQCWMTATDSVGGLQWVKDWNMTWFMIALSASLMYLFPFWGDCFFPQWSSDVNYYVCA